MKKPVDIGGGWKAIPVEGGGVIIQAEMSLLAVEWADLSDDGKLVNNRVKAPPKSIPAAGPVGIEEFLKAVNLRDLSTDGIYGPLGPTVKKFRNFLTTVEANSSLADSASEFLATGDRLRFGPIASLVSLNPEQVTVLNLALDSGDIMDLEHVLDKLTVGGAAEEMVAAAK